jgi:hypothetical protein
MHQPARIDPQTRCRYYSIRPLPRLNGILALKEARSFAGADRSAIEKRDFAGRVAHDAHD